jgi:hypothetical protein
MGKPPKGRIQIQEHKRLAHQIDPIHLHDPAECAPNLSLVPIVLILIGTDHQKKKRWEVEEITSK